MSIVSVTIESDEAILTSPYNPDVPSKAKAIGGRWHPASKTWRFDARDADRVRELARSIYGTDGTESTDDTVTLRVRTEGWSTDQAVIVAGRTVAERRDRDGDVRLAVGVVLVDGAFDYRGGSVRNPAIGRGDAVIEVRDFPRAAAEQAAASSWVEIVDDSGPSAEVLRSERDRLVARIAEIDALLEVTA